MGGIVPSDSSSSSSSPIDYRSAGALRRVQRPTAVTVLGVLSVCLGVLMALAHAGAVMALLPWLLSVTAPPAPPPLASLPPAPPPFPVVPYAGYVESADGLAPAARDRAVDAVMAKVKLPTERRRMLYRLLSAHGRRVFDPRLMPVARDAADEADFAALVREAGQLPAGRDGLRTLGTHYIKTSRGTVLLDDTVARFVGSEPAMGVRVALPEAHGPGAPPRPTAADLEEALARLRHRIGAGFTPVHARVLLERLAADGRLLLYDDGRGAADSGGGDGATALPGWRVAGDARLLAGGTLELRGPSRWFWIRTDGCAIDDPFGRDPATGARLAPPPAPTRPPVISRPQVWVLAGDAAAHAVLAAALGACGALVLAGSPRGAQRHAQWAWCSVALLALAVVPVSDCMMAAATEWTLRGRIATGRLPFAPLAVLAVMLLRAAWPAIVLGVVLRHASVRTHAAETGGTTAAITPAGWAAARRAVGRLLDGRPGGALRAAAVVLVLAAAVAHALGVAALSSSLSSSSSFAAATAETWWASPIARGVVPGAAVVAALLWVTALRGARRPAAATAPAGRGRATAIGVIGAMTLVIAGEWRAATAVDAGALPPTIPPGPAIPRRVEVDPVTRPAWTSTSTSTPSTRPSSRVPRTPNYDVVVARVRYATSPPEPGEDAEAARERTYTFRALRDEAVAGDLSLFVMLTDADWPTRCRAAAVLAHGEWPLRHPPGARAILTAALPQLRQMLRSSDTVTHTHARRLLLCHGPIGVRYVLAAEQEVAPATTTTTSPSTTSPSARPGDDDDGDTERARLRQLAKAMESASRPLNDAAVELRSAAAAGDLWLYELLASRDEALRLAAADLLTRHPPVVHPPQALALIERARPALRNQLLNNYLPTGGDAADLIAALGDDGVLELIDYIGSPEPLLHVQGTDAAGAHGRTLSPAAMARLETKIPALLDGIERGADTDERVRCVRALFRFRNTDVARAALRARATAWVDPGPMDENSPAAAVARAGGGDWFARAVNDLCTPCDACDDIVLTLAARGNAKIVELRSFRFRNTTDRDGARGQARLRAALAADDALVRRGGVAMVRHFTSRGGVRGGLSDEDYVEMLAATPDRDQPYVLAAAGAIIARAPADAFEVWTAAAVATTTTPTMTPAAGTMSTDTTTRSTTTTTTVIATTGEPDAAWRLRAASNAPLTPELEQLRSPDRSFRGVTPELFRAGPVAAAEAIWLALTSGADADVRLALGRYLAARPDRVSCAAPRWHIAAKAAAAREDPSAALARADEAAAAWRAAVDRAWSDAAFAPPVSSASAAQRPAWRATLDAAARDLAAPAAGVVLAVAMLTIVLSLIVVMVRAARTPLAVEPITATPPSTG